MKTSIAIVLFGAQAVLSSLLQPRACGNNCYRAIANNKITAIASADCSSYLSIGLTPDTTRVTTTTSTTTSVITTSTTFTTVSSVEDEGYKKLKNRAAVTVIPTAIPAYAAAKCTDEGDYSSACACLGIFATTSTAAVPTKVIGTSVTVLTQITGATTTTSTIVLPVPTGVSQGCFQDPNSHTVLTGKSIQASNTAMTHQFCANFCNQYIYYGVEFGYQCFCGNNNPSNLPQFPSSCNQACSGAPDEKCGAGNFIEVFKIM